MVRVRIAPSPTGKDLHIGNAYTALINYVFAKKHNGKFIIRIEDTDKSRTIPESESRILASLKWLGLDYDEGPDIGGPYQPYRQSQRLSLYQGFAEELLKKGHAYYCFCSAETLAQMRKMQQRKGEIPHYDGRCKRIKNQKSKIKNQKFVIRLNVPEEGITEFTDIVRGRIHFQNKQIDDQVLIKSDGFPTYHLAVVVDDHLMKVSHVIRGEEWISSTPKHVLLYRFFGWSLPKYAHLPLLRNPDRSKLSKRKNPVWVSWYKEQGFLPEALLNFLALMGWSHPKEKEIFSLKELINVFDLKRLQPVGPVFDVKKLLWMNGQYIRRLKVKSLKLKVREYIGNGYPEEIVEKTLPLVKDRMKTLSDYLSLAGFFFKKPVRFEKKINKNWIKKVNAISRKISQWRTSVLHERMEQLAADLGVAKSKLFMDVRVAITGKKVGPPLFESIEVLGKKETIERLTAVVRLAQNGST